MLTFSVPLEEIAHDNFVEDIFASLAVSLEGASSPRAAEDENGKDVAAPDPKEEKEEGEGSSSSGGGGMLSAAAWCWKNPKVRKQNDILNAVRQLRHWEVLRHVKSATLNTIARTAVAKKLSEVRESACPVKAVPFDDPLPFAPRQRLT